MPVVAGMRRLDISFLDNRGGAVNQAKGAGKPELAAVLEITSAVYHPPGKRAGEIPINL